MTLNLRMQSSTNRLKPKITVIGVGGAGGNAVNNMIASQLEGCEFLVCNTDAQALEGNAAAHKIQMGEHVTRGLGAGANPEVGRAAAEESIEEILSYLEGSNMVFVTAGMGGGTGTGAAAVIAQAAREQGILTVGVITKPFHFEGTHRMKLAEQGIEELQKHVDTLIVIPNQNLFRIANEKTTFSDAFRMADEVLQSGVRGVTDLMVMPGLINLDFADIRSVMAEMGKAMMGTGEAEGERRAVEAAEAAISNPLLDDVSMKGARGVLINITGGLDMTLFEVDEAANRIRDEVDPDANIIFGSTFDQSMEGTMRVSVVATGIEAMEGIKGRPLTIAGSDVEPQRAVVNNTSGFSGIRKSLGGSPTTTATAEQTRGSYNRDHYSAGGGIPQSILPSGLPQGQGVTQGATMNTTTTPTAQSTKAPVMAGGDVSTTTTAPTVGTAETTTGTGYAPSAAMRKVARDDIPKAPVQTQNYQRVVPPVSQSQPRGVRHGNSFIPPKPVDPRQSTSGDLFAGTETAKTEAKQPVAEKKPVAKKSPSLFERFTMSRKETAVENAPVETQGGLTVEKGGKADEDELDIPAFLRRQAN